MLDTTKDCFEFKCENDVLKKVRVCTGDVRVGDRVIAIEASAFAYNEGLHKITLPTVADIRNSAFSHCRTLHEAVIENGNVWVKTAAFKDCEQLQEVYFPNGASKIDAEAFADCPNLRLVVISKPVGYINQTAFDNCKNVVVRYMDKAFDYSNIKGLYDTINIPVPTNADVLRCIFFEHGITDRATMDMLCNQVWDSLPADVKQDCNTQQEKDKLLAKYLPRYL